MKHLIDLQDEMSRKRRFPSHDDGSPDELHNINVPTFISQSCGTELKTVEMHTCGEPTRIVYSGYPDLPYALPTVTPMYPLSDLQSGTLLEQREYAMSHHDNLRRALICEPRGHRDMYGAVLCWRTELTETGKAHTGVLFLTNDGYSTMCGHATLALGRLIVDQAGSGEKKLFDLGMSKDLMYDPKTQTMAVDLHVPCGLVSLQVPVVFIGTDTWKVDTSRMISYQGTPSWFSDSTFLSFSEPATRWPELGDREEVNFGIAYGGAFYIMVEAKRLGFTASDLENITPSGLAALSNATRLLKEEFNRRLVEWPETRRMWLRHPDYKDDHTLYGVIVTARPSSTGQDTYSNLPPNAESGICFFANQQVDRSPTGSGAQARVALGWSLADPHPEPRTFHSPVSWAYGGEGAFVAEVVGHKRLGNVSQGVKVKISGKARYTGVSSFVVEDDDEIGKGFWFDELGKRSES